MRPAVVRRRPAWPAAVPRQAVPRSAVRRPAAAGMLAVGLLALAGVLLSPGPAAAAAAPAGPVVVVGVSGLRWSEVTRSGTPALWRLAGQGSVGSLVDHAVLPLTCPADGWLTLNAGTRAQSRHTEAGCGAFPAVVGAGAGADVPSLPALQAYNTRYDPDFGLLASEVPGCATAVGPGAALALASRSGRVASYLPSAAELSAAVLARCPLTVVDLGAIGSAERAAKLAATDTEIARIQAELPPAATLLVTAPGAVTMPPHLQVALVAGPGYRAGLLDASSTRQPGLVTLTDLTPAILGWLGRPVPAGLPGARITRGDRGALAAAVRSLTSRDTAEQVWRSSHGEFFWCYALADALALLLAALFFRGSSAGCRRQRARWWRGAGVVAAAGPAGTFLANLVPWAGLTHPAAWLYGVAAALALALAAVALAGPWRRDPVGPFGFVSLVTLLVLGVDVMTGSRLQLEAPFGLSVLEAGRFYGIGNEALGIYGVTALLAAAWLARLAGRRWPGSRRPAVAAVAAVGSFAVLASGWPGFGAKVGGTIAMVPCFVLLGLAVAGARLTWRRIAATAVSGLALFVVFALVSYFVPATGRSDIGSFAGAALHGRAGALLLRKIDSNVGSLSVNAFSPLVPAVVLLTGLMLWRPRWFGLRTLPLACADDPLLLPVLWLLWLLPVLGWFADDSGVIVAAAAAPLALPLGIALAAAVAYPARAVPYGELTSRDPDPVPRVSRK